MSKQQLRKRQHVYSRIIAPLSIIGLTVTLGLSFVLSYADTNGLLWMANYDAVTDPLSVTAAWYREQEPHAPGSNGPLQTDRIRVVGGSEVPGSGSNKPAGKAMRVELRPYNTTSGSISPDGDVNLSGSTNRAEVYGRYPTTNATSTPPANWPDPVGSTRWYGFSVFVPTDFTTDDTKWFTLTQWKGFYGGSPPQAIEIDGSRFRLGGTHGLRDLGPINKGQWTRFEVGFHWSTSSTDGWIQAYRNGTEIIPKSARSTMDISSGKADPIYFKQGIYRTKGWAVTHTLYFGPAKVGLTQADVAINNAILVNSGIITPPSPSQTADNEPPSSDAEPTPQSAIALQSTAIAPTAPAAVATTTTQTNNSTVLTDQDTGNIGARTTTVAQPGSSSIAADQMPAATDQQTTKSKTLTIAGRAVDARKVGVYGGGSFAVILILAIGLYIFETCRTKRLLARQHRASGVIVSDQLTQTVPVTGQQPGDIIRPKNN